MDQNNKNSIDEIDQRIIEALQLDGRRPFTKLAAELGISEASVRQRVANLINTHVMQIVAITNPVKLGFSLASMIGIRVSGDRLLEVANEIAAFEGNVESAPGNIALTGIGINLNAAALPDEIAKTATSVRIEQSCVLDILIVEDTVTC